MKRNLVLNAFAGACIFLPTAFLHAEEGGEPATIRLSHGMLSYGMATSEESANGTTNKVEGSGIATFPAGIEIAVFHAGYAVYAYPVSQNEGSIWLGKAIGSNMEAGVSFALNSSSIKDGDEESNNSFGAYFYYSRPLTSKVTFELDVNPSLIMGSGKEVSGTPAVTTESDTSGYSLYLDLLGAVPLAKNFEYVFGLAYTYSKTEKEEKSGGVTTTTKTTDTDLELILARFRYLI